LIVGFTLGLAIGDAPPLQLYVYGEVPPDAVGEPPMATLNPLHTLNPPPGPADAVGTELTVTLVAAVAVQLNASVTVTAYGYVPAVFGFTVATVELVGDMFEPLHEYTNGVVPPVTLADRLSLVALPTHHERLPADDILTDGLLLVTLTTTCAVEEHPFASCTVTV